MLASQLTVDGTRCIVNATKLHCQVSLAANPRRNDYIILPARSQYMANLVFGLFVCIALLSGAGTVHSQSRLPPCTSNSDRDNCFGEAQISGGHFVGEFRSGKPNGQGTLTAAMGVKTLKFIGEFRDGRPAEGRFIVRESDGVEYNFASKDGKPDFGGEVTKTFPDGSKLHTGNAKDDNAVWTLTWPDGSKFVGQITVPEEHGKFTGRGTVTYADGTTYVGEIQHGKLSGNGVLKVPNGRTYSGEFKDDLLQGKGRLTEPNGTTYVGDFKDGKVEGQGTLTWPDGRRYVGEFKNEKASR